MSILNPVASAPLEAPMEVQTVSLPQRLRSILPVGIAGFTSIIFLDSLRYKFTNHPNTQVIFGKLNDWATSFGAEGLFAQTGLFSQYVIGTAELAASALLLFGILPALRRLQAIGSLIAVLVMTGAISFHLFTPLGIDHNNAGGGGAMGDCRRGNRLGRDQRARH